MDNFDQALIDEFDQTDRRIYMIALLQAVNEVLPEYIERLEKLDGSQLNYGRKLVDHIDFVVTMLCGEDS